MAFAVIDYADNIFLNFIRCKDTVGEVNIFLPLFKNNKSKRYARRTVRMLNRDKINLVVLNNELLKNNVFCKELIDNKKYIITGNRLYKVLICRILRDIASQMEINLAQLKVGMLINEYSLDNLELIKNVAKIVKTLTIITNDKKKFDGLIYELFEKDGIVLKVFEKSNLKNVNIIVNVDLCSEEMNKLSFNNNSLVICCCANNYKIKQNFNGIIIRNIDIISGVVNNPRVSNLSLCEAKIYNYLRKLNENDRVFEREGYKINGYIGENGKITKKEFQNLGKIILDK